MNLAQEMRPKTFEEVIGNSHITEPLKRQLENGELNHSLLITGDTGTGKTTLAHIIATELKAQVEEVDCGSDGGIDVIRGLIESSMRTSLFAKNKVFILDEVHKLSNPGQSALLRTLETAQENVYFILLTNEPGKLLKTIRTRCLHYSTTPPGTSEIGIAVNRVLDKYGIVVEDRKDFWTLVEQSEGSLRQVYSLLEKLIAASDESGVITSATFSATLGGLPDEEASINLARLFMKGELRPTIQAIKESQKRPELNPYSQTIGTYNYLKAAYLGGASVDKAMMVDLAAVIKTKAVEWLDLEGVAWAHLK